MRLFVASVFIVFLFIAFRLEVFGSCASRTETISMDPVSGGGITITLPASWKTKVVHGFEDSVYYFSDKGQVMLVAGVLNNPDIEGLTGNAEVISVTASVLNGLKATEFRRKSGLSDIIVENRCGGYKYAWLKVISKDPKNLAVISTVMTSVACIPAKTT